MKPGTALRRISAGLLALAVVGGGAEAYVRLQVGSTLLHWQDPGAVTWRWSAHGSADVEDGSDEAAIARAFENWEVSAASRAGFVRQADTWSQDINADSHLIVFDEDGSSGWFPAGAGVVAVTPIRYATSDGRILDADILFNGRDYSFSTDRSAGSFDIQDVATHEIGHLLGLDHSPVLSATMWPWVSQQQDEHRSLAADDHAGAAALAARGNPGRLTGTLRGPGGGLLKGARISALSTFDGQLMASALSATDGRFTLRGLPVGDYHLHIAPVSDAFTSGNLIGAPNLAEDFGADFWGGWGAPRLFVVLAGTNTTCGTWTGADAPPMRESSTTPVILQPGQSGWVIVPMSGAPAAMNAWTRGGLIIVQQVQQTSNYLRAYVAISAAATAGVWDLFLQAPSGELAVASGAIEVVAPPPNLATLSATTGDPLGGETVTLYGAGFQADGWVLFGGIESPSINFIDASTLEVHTPVGSPGLVDVIVINADGQETRMLDGFRYTITPRLDSILPTAGQSIGLTQVYLQGTGFGPQTEVLLDGIPLTATLVAPGVLQVVTQPHSPGTAELILQNPQAPPEVHPAAFRFIAAPDPVVTGMTPNRGPRGGGTRVQLSGKGLGETAQIRFGVDPVSGSGGSAGSSLAVHNGGVVAATTVGQPGSGAFGVLVTTDSGQGVLISSFTFEEEAAGSSQGCGGVIHSGKPVDPLAGLLELALPFLAYGLTRLRGRGRLQLGRCFSASS